MIEKKRSAGEPAVNQGVLYMREWMDLNDDGEIDAFEADNER